MEIKRQEQGHRGYFQAIIDGQEAGRLNWVMAGKDKMILDHTETFEGFQGKGVGNQLVEEAIHYARKQGLKVIPLCPFAKSVIRDKKELQDVVF